MLSEVISCIFCEGVRQEVGGKATIVGFGGVLPHVTVGIPGAPPRNISMNLMILAKGEGRSSVDFEILDPHDHLLADQRSVQIDWDNPDQIANIVAVFQNLSLACAGRYTVRLLADHKEAYKSSFLIQFGPE
jgi:hypothetical protein